MKDSDKIISMESKIEIFREELQKISSVIEKFPLLISKMIKEAFDDQNKYSSQIMKLTIEPIIEKGNKHQADLHDLKNRIMRLEIMRGQIIAIVSLASLLINILIKFIF